MCPRGKVTQEDIDRFERELYSDILKKLKQTETSKGELRQKEIEQKINFINLGLEWFKDEM